MKKIIITIMLISTLTVSFVGCGSKPKGDDSSNTKVEDSGNEISAQENLFNIEVRIPASYLEGTDITEFEAEVKEIGGKDVKVNEDGSVSYKLNKSTHKKLLADMKKSVDESIAEVLKDKESFPSFTGVTYNDDLTEFNIFIDSATFSPFESIGALGYYIYGNMYQAMNCVNEGDINTKVNFIDKDTNEIIETGNSSEL